MANLYGAKIKEMREERAWPQEQLAEVCGVAARTIQRAEAGDSIAFESLKAIANGLEIDVKEFMEKPAKTPDPTPAKTHNLFLFIRLRTGADLFKVCGGADAGRFAQDELNDSQVEDVASFSQDLHDYADEWNDIEAGEHIRIIHSFTERIQHLESIGLSVFGLRTRSRFKADDNEGELKIGNVYVAATSNPTISRTGEVETIPVNLERYSA